MAIGDRKRAREGQRGRERRNKREKEEKVADKSQG